MEAPLALVAGPLRPGTGLWRLYAPAPAARSRAVGGLGARRTAIGPNGRRIGSRSTRRSEVSVGRVAGALAVAGHRVPRHDPVLGGDLVDDRPQRGQRGRA